MAFDLAGFIGKNADFSRGYTFYCRVTNTAFVRDEFQKHLVKSSGLPVSNNTKAEVNWQGNHYKIGATQDFTTFKISYVSDISNYLRNSYENWMTEIHNPINNIHGNPATYMGDIILEHLSHKSGLPIMVYTLHKAWPTSVSELALDYNSRDVATFDVTFEYQWHTFENPSVGP